MMKKIIIGSDHAGFKMKQRVKSFLQELPYEIKDVGTTSESSVDYPDIVSHAVQAFKDSSKADADSKENLGILICGTGIGVSIAANKFKGVTCALIHDLKTAEMAKAHNHVNFIALGSRVEYRDDVTDIIKAFLNTQQETGRHEKRINKIKLIEEGKYGN